MRTSTNENLVSQNHYYQNHLISNNLLFFYDTDPAQAARLLRRHGTGMQKHEALQLNQRAPNAENIGERFNDLSNSPFTGAMTMENFWNQRLWIRKITQLLNCESPLSMGFAYAFYPHTELESRKHITYSLLVWGFAMYLGFWLLGLHWRFTSCVCVWGCRPIFF